MLILLLNPRKIAKNHTDWKPHNNFKRIENIKELNIIMSLKDKYPSNSIFFNAQLTRNGHIPFMFHTSYTAYYFIPNPEQIEELKSLNYAIKVLDIGDIPDYIQNDPEIEIIEIGFK